MALTFEELKEKLIRVDEVSLLEVLNISSEDLVERFEDFIEDRRIALSADFEDDPEDLDEEEG